MVAMEETSFTADLIWLFEAIGLYLGSYWNHLESFKEILMPGYSTSRGSDLIGLGYVLGMGVLKSLLVQCAVKVKIHWHRETAMVLEFSTPQTCLAGLIKHRLQHCIPEFLIQWWRGPSSTVSGNVLLLWPDYHHLAEDHL